MRASSRCRPMSTQLHIPVTPEGASQLQLRQRACISSKHQSTCNTFSGLGIFCIFAKICVWVRISQKISGGTVSGLYQIFRFFFNIFPDLNRIKKTRDRRPKSPQTWKTKPFRSGRGCSQRSVGHFMIHFYLCVYTRHAHKMKKAA